MTKLSTLDDHLFAALDRLGAQGLSGDDLTAEVQRAGAIVGVADQLIASNRTKIEAAKLFAAHGNHVLPMLPQIGGPKE
jgi:hypothetical protein